MIFLELQEASLYLKDAECDIKLCARVILTEKKPNITINLFLQSKNLYLHKDKSTFLAKRGRHQNRVKFALGFVKTEPFFGIQTS